jgi:hypothetical protein
MIHQVSAFVENQPGRLSEITGALAARGINIRAFTIADTADFGILRLIANDPDLAVEVLRAINVTVKKTEVLAVRLDDTPGSMHKVLDALREDGVSIEYAYAFPARKTNDAYVILRAESMPGASDALRSRGFDLLTAEEIAGV